MTDTKDISSILKESIPKGWRFYTCDNSILDRYSVTLVRDEEGKKWWHTLSEEKQALIPLFLSGTADTFDAAIIKAISTIGDHI